MTQRRDTGEALDLFGAFVSRAAASQSRDGSLSGLRLAVKDNIAVKGEPFTAGLPLFADRIADEDASCVTRLKEAGARFVGMTRTDAAGFGVVTPDVANPVWPDRIAGGSSGGSAAAVAAGLADIGLGTDTGGSTRIPAACCGIFGFKSSHGRIPTDGVWPLAPSFDVIGWMTRDLETLEAVAGVMLGAPREPVAPERLRIGIDPARLARCANDVREAFEETQRLLAARGMMFRSVSLPPQDSLNHAHAITVLHEAQAFYPDWTRYQDRLPVTAQRALAAARTLSPADVDRAAREITALRGGFERIFTGVDVILSPTLPMEPPAKGTSRIEIGGRPESIVSVLVSETCPANITGGPALSLPLPQTKVSLQLLANAEDDMRLIAIAQHLHRLIRADPAS